MDEILCGSDSCFFFKIFYDFIGIFGTAAYTVRVARKFQKMLCVAQELKSVILDHFILHPIIIYTALSLFLCF